jgi:hypothetical protein
MVIVPVFLVLDFAKGTYSLKIKEVPGDSRFPLPKPKVDNDFDPLD